MRGSLKHGIVPPLIPRRCLAETIEALNKCKSMSPGADGSGGFGRKLKSFARSVTRRADLLADVKRCRSDMQTALDLFNVRIVIRVLQSDHVSLRHADEATCRSVLRNEHSRHRDETLDTTGNTGVSHNPPRSVRKLIVSSRQPRQAAVT